MQTAQHIWMLCRAAAQEIYGTRPPSPQYADRVARLLFGTAAHESAGFRWHRQRTPRWEGNVGGFSKWQLETVSIQDSLAWLRRRPDVLARATDWLFRDPHATPRWTECMDLEAILWAMRLADNDRIGVLFGRLHYLRVPAPVPELLDQQALYWKTHYNTIAGAGTATQYLISWRRHCAPVLELETPDAQ